MRAVLVRYRYADPELRARHRAEHIERLRSLADDGVLLVAGPDESGDGAVLVLRVPDLPVAVAIMDADVYLRSGAVTSYTAEAFDPIVTTPDLSG